MRTIWRVVNEKTLSPPSKTISISPSQKLFLFCCKSFLRASIESNGFYLHLLSPTRKFEENFFSLLCLNAWACRRVGNSSLVEKWPLCINDELRADEDWRANGKLLKQSRSDVLNDKWAPNAFIHVFDCLASVILVQRFFNVTAQVVVVILTLRNHVVCLLRIKKTTTSTGNDDFLKGCKKWMKESPRL